MSSRKNKNRNRVLLDEFGNVKKLSILNPNNKLITAQVINDVLQTCGVDYRIKDIERFQQAFVNKSYVVINNPDIIYEQLEGCVELQPASNERLEYFGDSIYGGIVSNYLFHRYPNQSEGFMTKNKAKLARTERMAKYIRYLGLQEYLLISKHVEEMCNGRENDRILEDLFESFIGALFEDVYQDDMDNYGEASQICANFVIGLMEDTIDFRDLIMNNDNYKEQLLMLVQKMFSGAYPEYKVISEEGPTNKRIYTVGVIHPENEDLIIGRGVGRKKVEAEQIASKEAIKYLDPST